MAIDTIDDVLSHYGVKGMRWGVRKRSGDSGSTGPTQVVVKAKPGVGVKTSGGQGHGPSDDAVKAAIARQKARKSGPHSLSNAEMKQLVERMNLESQYSRLTADDNKKKNGQAFIDDLLSGPQAKIAIDFAKFGTRNNPDPRVKLGLQVAETIVNSRKKK